MAHLLASQLFLSQTALHSNVSLVETPSLEKPQWGWQGGGGSSERFWAKWAPSKVHSASLSAQNGQSAAQGCELPSWNRLTFPPEGGPGGRQEQDAEAAAEPERGHGRAGPGRARRPLLQGSLPGAPGGRWWFSLCTPVVPSFSSIRWFYRLFYLTQS